MKWFKKLIIYGLTAGLLPSLLLGASLNTASVPVSSAVSSVSTQSDSLKQGVKKINGVSVTYVTINMNASHIIAKVMTANNTIYQSAALKDMALSANAAASINGTYFAAYNGDTPFPDGTIIKSGKPLHITDIGCTVGFTSDHRVLIDFVKTRVQGYINGKDAWSSYRVNRSTPDPSATVIYTEEYGNKVSLASGLVGVVCQYGQVIKKLTGTATIPKDGFILAMNETRSLKYTIGDNVTYKIIFYPQNTSPEEWQNVTEAISAGPSLLINGKATVLPKEEGFTEAKILTQTARRSFIGTNNKNQLIIGTASASISQMKEIVCSLGLVNAMCLDGGASSGLYYKNQYLTSPGRKINNCINFIYQK